MKMGFLFFVTVFAAGCVYSDSVSTAAPNVQEFFVDVRVDTDSTGEFQFGEDGHLRADCTLGARSVTKNRSSSQAIEGIRRAIGAFQGVCHFKEPLPFDFCALTSAQLDMECKVGQSGVGSGWFVEAGFEIPHTTVLHCAIACINFVAG